MMYAFDIATLFLLTAGILLIPRVAPSIIAICWAIVTTLISVTFWNYRDAVSLPIRLSFDAIMVVIESGSILYLRRRYCASS